LGLILNSSLLIADERENFDLSSWLRARRPEPVAASAITLSELWFGIEVETDSARSRRRRRWLERTVRRLEIVPLNAAVARVHARLWVQLSEAGRMIGPHDLIVAATALHRQWAVATFNAAEFQHIRGLQVLKP
jgi:predicted nucleic acid-binding protein